MTRELQWQTLIKQVLISAGEALSHHEIANRIAALGVLKELGSNPAMTVNSTVSNSIKRSKLKSPFFRPQRGLIALRSSPRKPAHSSDSVNRLISSYGLHWEKSMIRWKPNPELLGTKPKVPKPVNFCRQKAVYILYQDLQVIYVGSSARDHLGNRLLAHATGPLANKWNRFSWFGLYPIQSSPDQSIDILQTDSNLGGLGLEYLVRGLEAVLIEALLPPRNRRGGDTLKGVEFIQVCAPEKARSENTPAKKDPATKRSRSATKPPASKTKA